MKTQTENMGATDLGMSNCDHSIDDGFEDILKGYPGEVFVFVNLRFYT